MSKTCCRERGPKHKKLDGARKFRKVYDHQCDEKVVPKDFIQSDFDDDTIPKFEIPDIRPNNVKFVESKVNDIDPTWFSMTGQERMIFELNEGDVEIFPFKASHGIYLMRTKVKSTKGKEDNYMVRMIIVDIYHCLDFEKRNEEDDRGEMLRTSIISTKADFSLLALLNYTSDKFVDDMMKEYLGSESELIKTSKKNISINTIGVLIEFMKKYGDIQGSIPKLSYYERRIRTDRLAIEGIKVVSPQYFYDFFRSRWDNSKETFESFMAAIKAAKIERSSYLKQKYYGG